MFPPVIHFLVATHCLGACPVYYIQSTAGPRCGVVGQAGALGWGLSQNGIICGTVSQCNADTLPFFQLPGGPVIPLTQVGADKSGRALAVNSAGVVVGYVDSDPLSFRYHAGQTQWLQPLRGDYRTEVEGMNEVGACIGASISVNTVTASIWIGTTAQSLQLPFGPFSRGEDLNNVGAACGWMGGLGPHPLDPLGGSIPFIWHKGLTSALPLPSQAANNTGAATALNNRGDACGYYYTFNRTSKQYVRQACAWIDGQLIDLGTLPGFAGSFPADINDAREIVGYVTEETGVALVPFVWRDGVMHDLNTLVPPGSPPLGLARGVNNKGQIVGEAYASDPNPHSLAFLLTPAPPQHPGDVNCDSVVNVTDLLAVIAAWNPIGPVGGRPADLNRDNKIDVFDLFETIINWG